MTFRLRTSLVGAAFVALLGGSVTQVAAAPAAQVSAGSAATTAASGSNSPLDPRDQHNAAVIAQRSQGDDTNNVFAPYSPTGTSTWATNWTAGLDLTGIGWNSNQAGTLISPQHVVMAAHYPVGVGGTIVFTDSDGDPHARTLTARQTIRMAGFDTDISVGVLDRPIFDVSFYRVMAPHPLEEADPVHGYGSYEQLMSNALFVSTNHSRQAFLRRGSMTGISPAYVWHHPADNVRSTDGQLDLNPAWTMNLIGGDSGHPSFFPHDGELLLMGTHEATVRFPYVANPAGQASINAAMTALGGGPYQLETVEARPRVEPPPGGVSCNSPRLHGFSDATNSNYYTAVLWLVAAHITSGTGPCTFSPNNPVTRAQMAIFLWHNADDPAPTGTHNFEDVPAGSYYNQAVTWLVEAGITGGTAPGRFSPNSPVTRAQMAVFLWHAANDPAPTGTRVFDDVPAGSYYAPAVAWLVGAWITGGTTATTYSPHRPVTRSQMAIFLWEFNGHPEP